MSDRKNWEDVKARYPLGKFVQGEAEFHMPFGVFINIGELSVKGLIKIPDFLDKGVMSEDMYPAIGTKVGAIVVGYKDRNCREVYLNAKPSVLHRALVPLTASSVASK